MKMNCSKTKVIQIKPKQIKRDNLTSFIYTGVDFMNFNSKIRIWNEVEFDTKLKQCVKRTILEDCILQN